jgi:low affinity Fe/Cu permease
MNDLFRKFAHNASNATGTPWAFLLAVGVILVWVFSGPIFGYSDTWQLVINTGTTIVTFLMVFLIQNTQNRDAVALHLKLDELLRVVEGAREEKFVDLEEQSDEVVKEVKRELVEQAGTIAAAQAEARAEQTGSSEVNRADVGSTAARQTGS